MRRSVSRRAKLELELPGLAGFSGCGDLLRYLFEVVSDPSSFEF